MGHRLSLGVLGALTALAFAACSDPATRPGVSADGRPQPGSGVGGGGSADTSTPGDGGAGAGDGGTACNDLDLADAAPVDQLAAVDNPPPGAGGTLETATYVLTDARIYGAGSGGPTGLSVRGELVLQIDGASGTFSRLIDMGATSSNRVETRDRGTIVVASSNAVLTVQCPGTRQEQVSFTATATTLVMTNLTTRDSYTFTKR